MNTISTQTNTQRLAALLDLIRETRYALGQVDMLRRQFGDFSAGDKIQILEDVINEYEKICLSLDRGEFPVTEEQMWGVASEEQDVQALYLAGCLRRGSCKSTTEAL